MNEKNRIKFLKLRQRADQFELEALESEERLNKALDAAAARVEKAERALADLQNTSTLGAMESRQKIARLESALNRALLTLERIASPPDGQSWRETVTNSEKWDEMQPRLGSVSVAAGGTGGIVNP
jgi:hypothetical protein